MRDKFHSDLEKYGPGFMAGRMRQVLPVCHPRTDPLSHTQHPSGPSGTCPVSTAVATHVYPSTAVAATLAGQTNVHSAATSGPFLASHGALLLAPQPSSARPLQPASHPTPSPPPYHQQPQLQAEHHPNPPTPWPATTDSSRQPPAPQQPVGPQLQHLHAPAVMFVRPAGQAARQPMADKHRQAAAVAAAAGAHTLHANRAVSDTTGTASDTQAPSTVAAIFPLPASGSSTAPQVLPHLLAAATAVAPSLVGTADRELSTLEGSAAVTTSVHNTSPGGSSAMAAHINQPLPLTSAVLAASSGAAAAPLLPPSASNASTSAATPAAVSSAPTTPVATSASAPASAGHVPTAPAATHVQLQAGYDAAAPGLVNVVATTGYVEEAAAAAAKAPASVSCHQPATAAGGTPAEELEWPVTVHKVRAVGSPACVAPPVLPSDQVMVADKCKRFFLGPLCCTCLQAGKLAAAAARVLLFSSWCGFAYRLAPHASRTSLLFVLYLPVQLESHTLLQLKLRCSSLLCSSCDQEQASETSLDLFSLHADQGRRRRKAEGLQSEASAPLWQWPQQLSA